MTTDGNGDRVSYTVKELLYRMDEKLDQLDAKLDQKADREKVHEIQSTIAALDLVTLKQGGPITETVRDHEARLRLLEAPNPAGLIAEFRETQREVDTLKSWRARVVGALAVVGPAALAALTIAIRNYFAGG